MKKIALILSLVLLMTLGLMSCSDSRDAENLEKFEQLLEELESEPTAAGPFAEKLYLIIPQDASAELSSKARRLALAINEKTKVETIVKYDNENTVLYSDDLLMLLGNTDNLISQEAIRSLRYGEYICKWDRDTIVLGGRHDSDTVAAINEFTEKILPGSSNASLMGDGVYIENSVEYEVDAVTLNGYDLYDFTFVCSEDTREKTEILRDHVARRSGYLLDIVSDAEEAVGKTVSVSIDADGADAVIEPKEKNLSLCGSDSYGLSVAIAEFAELLFENISNGEAKAQITERVTGTSYVSNVRMCSAYLLHNENNHIGWIDDTVDMIKNGGCHIFTFASVTRVTWEYVEMNIPDGYKYLTLPAENGSVYPIVYRDSAFENVDCELSEELLIINVKVKGEAQERRIIRVFNDSDDLLSKLSALLQEQSVYDTVVFDGSGTSDIVQKLSLEFVESDAWEYANNEYSHSLLVEKALRADNAEKKKTRGSGYANIYLCASIEVEYCEKFALLNDAVE